MPELSQDEVCREALRHRSALVAYAFAQLRDWNRAEDVVQDATVVLLGKWQDCTGLETVHAWVRGMVRNKIKELRRSERRERPVELDALEELATGCVERALDREGGLAHAARVRALQGCLQELPRRKRVIIDGYYRQRRSCDAIADDLGSSANAIQQVLSRLRRLLKDCAGQRLAAEGLA